MQNFAKLTFIFYFRQDHFYPMELKKDKFTDTQLYNLFSFWMLTKNIQNRKSIPLLLFAFQTISERWKWNQPNTII